MDNEGALRVSDPDYFQSDKWTDKDGKTVLINSLSPKHAGYAWFHLYEFNVLGEKGATKPRMTQTFFDTVPEFAALRARADNKF